jgi:hypothetical protein
MVETTLGPCHYSEDMSEKATLLAVLKDGTGWIPICEDHKSEAESDGYTPQEVVDVPNAMDQDNGDDNAGEGDGDADDGDGDGGDNSGGADKDGEDEDSSD